MMKKNGLKAASEEVEKKLPENDFALVLYEL